MSNFSTIYDQLIDTTIPGISGFNTKTKITNPYDVGLNSFNLLRNGYGILIGDAVESSFGLIKETWVDQEVGVVLTRALRATDHNATPLETLTKNLVEDAILLRKDFLNQDQITIPSNVEKIDFINRSAIEFINLEESNIVFTIVSFNFVISETI